MKIKPTECEKNSVKLSIKVTKETLLTSASLTTTTPTTISNIPQLPPISLAITTTTPVAILPVVNQIKEPRRIIEKFANIPQEALQLNNNVNGLSTPPPTTTATKINTTATKSKKAAAATTTANPSRGFSSTFRSLSENCIGQAMAAATASNNANHLTNSDNVSKNDLGVLDFTINSSAASSITSSSSSTSSSLTSSLVAAAAVAVSAANNNNNNLKVPKSSNCLSNCSNDIPRTSSSSSSINNNGGTANSFGGRLQFFKDGKFILELARSKEGEKGGWVSVPRRLFRTPAAATSATVTPTSAALVAYPKNENSTSLSFSDDNSSIQSSPWQRDHSWKQSAPRKNISKEMSLFFHHPKNILLNSYGGQMARKKRRNPYEKSAPHEKIFEFQGKEEAKNDNKVEKLEDIDICKVENASIKEEIKEESEESKSDLEQKPEDDKTESETKIKAEVKVETKTEVDGEANVCEVSEDPDVTMKSTESLNKVSNNGLNGSSTEDSGNEKKECIVEKEQPPMEIKCVPKKRRIKTLKTRAKLNTIIQKLIDNMPARVFQASKTGLTNGSGSSHMGTPSNTLVHAKVSPPSSASRLVEYHQQHVSPRKRILREFEKVSLEDKSPIAGGKRSRAKSSLNSAPTTTQFQNSRSPTNRNSLPSPSSGIGSTANGSNAKSKANTSTPPARLNSSYSIHSLLSNSNSSSSSNTGTNCPSGSKKLNDQNSMMSSSNHQNSCHYAEPKGYQSAVLVSPKSPEGSHHNHYGIGGKSPSQSSFKRRSPPYASPMHEAHSRSPIIVHNNHSNDYNNSHSPHSSPAHLHSSVNRKMLYANESSSGASHSPSSHHLMQQSNQNYYSSYMMSSPTSATNSSISPSNGVLAMAHSPRHPSAFAPTSTISSIPSNSSSSSTVHAMSSKDISPPRPSNDHIREASTPRTVPKKTASIRRQFASPTASTTSSCPSPIERSNEDNFQSTSNYHDRKTPVSSVQNQHMLQRSSPNASAVPSISSGGIPSPLNYYMYPHASALNGASNQMHHLASTNPAAAASAAYNIPPMLPPSSYYNPYFMTLAALRQNPMWLHQYPGAVPLSAAAASRLSSPFHNFPYNGVNPAAVAAAAAAGLSLPSPSPVSLSHLQQAAHAQQHLMGSAAYHNNAHNLGSRHITEHTTKTTDSIDNSTTKNSNPLSNSARQHQQQPPQHQHQQHQQHQHHQSSASLSSVAPSNMSSSSSRYPVDTNRSKEHEQSSDVPLNLSKH